MFIFKFHKAGIEIFNILTLCLYNFTISVVTCIVKQRDNLGKQLVTFRSAKNVILKDGNNQNLTFK